MKIIPILPTLTQPRFQKRIETLQKITDHIHIYAFDRGLYKENTITHENITVIGKTKNKQYLSRLFNYFRIVTNVLLNKDNRGGLFYIFNFDIAVLAWIFLPSKSYVYEIGDFAYLGFGKTFRNFLTKIDAKIIKKSFFTVLTSEGFKRYLTKFVRASDISENLVIIPNRLSDKILQFDRDTRPFQDVSSLSFGFAGLLRYPDTILRFAKIIADKYPNHQFHFFGDGPMRNQVEELTNRYENIFYHGPYKNPEEIGKIYETIDLCVSCYDTNGLNQKLAEPNKLYEAIYFGTPIIVSKDTYLAEKVISEEIGYVIDAHYNDEIIAFLDDLTQTSLNKARSNQLKIASEALLYSEKEIMERLKAFESDSTK